MKIKFIALALLLGGLSTACQKEEMVEQNCHAVENNETATITYIIDNKSFAVEIRNDREREELFSYLLLMAKEGHKVSCYDESKREQTYGAKEKVTYETANEAEANKLGKQFTVINYDIIGVIYKNIAFLTNTMITYTQICIDTSQKQIHEYADILKTIANAKITEEKDTTPIGEMFIS